MKSDSISFTSAVHVKMPTKKIRGICPNDYNFYAMDYAINKVKAISRKGADYINWPPDTNDYLIINGKEKAYLDGLKEKRDLAGSKFFDTPYSEAVPFIRESLPKVSKDLPFLQRVKAKVGHIRDLFELKKMERTPNRKWGYLRKTPLNKLVNEKIETIQMDNYRLYDDAIDEYRNGLNSIMDSESTKKLVFPV